MPIITWGPPVQVTAGRHLINVNIGAVNDEPGIYYFSRRHGDGPFCPFYIGKSQNLQTRLHQYLYNDTPHEVGIRNILLNVDGAAHEWGIPNGPRFYHYGYLNRAPGLQFGPTIARAERAFIHYALILGWNLVNNHHAGDAAFRTFEMAGDRTDDFVPDRLLAPR